MSPYRDQTNCFGPRAIPDPPDLESFDRFLDWMAEWGPALALGLVWTVVMFGLWR